LCKENSFTTENEYFYQKFKKMNQTLLVNATSRTMVSKILASHSLEQLNKIPASFSNNMIWNIAHIIVTQQLLVYKLSGLPMMVSDEMIEKYKKGTKPEQEVTQAEVDEIKSLLFSTIEKTKEDYENGVFKNFQEYPTSTGFVLANLEGAMNFNNFHEGLHIGVLMSIRKLV
jgi:hypothetical protein